MKEVQIQKDLETVWFNTVSGLIGRFNRRMFDIHGIQGTCNNCSKVHNIKEDWLRFVSVMRAVHDIKIGNECLPENLRIEVTGMSVQLKVEDLKPGDKIRWNLPNSAKLPTGERVNQREGVFLCLIPRNESPLAVAPEEYIDAKRSRCELGNGKSGISKNLRMLVRVQEIGKRGKLLPPRYYGPMVSAFDCFLGEDNGNAIH